MAFEWNRIHKTTDYVEGIITDCVYDYVFDYYGVGAVEDITQEQLDEIIEYRDSMNEYDFMVAGFNNLINELEDLLWEE